MIRNSRFNHSQIKLICGVGGIDYHTHPSWFLDTIYLCT